ncbi:hypothetical protein FB451DRAFT_1188939 [Mycena latifolia]|nr:hypothetical protein FB451DRAFT_1188939 [Mycena latifolia]
MYNGYAQIPALTSKSPIKVAKKPKDSEPRESPKQPLTARCFLGARLRRKTGEAAPEEVSTRAASSDDTYAPPAPPILGMHPIELAPARAHKAAARLRENAVPLQRSMVPAPADASVSQLLRPHRTSSASGGSSGDERFIDDSYLPDESGPITPIEFRPPSSPGFQQETVCDGAGGDSAAVLWEQQPLNGPEPHRRARAESYRHDRHCPDPLLSGPEADADTESTEEAWLGAWNEDDIHAVIHKLRSLK